MKVELEKLENGRVLLRIQIPVEDVNAELERNYRSVRTQVSVPGFRKGKVPIGMIKSRFGEYVNAEAVQNLVFPAYEEALSSELLTPLSQPEITPALDRIQVQVDAPLHFEATVDIKPSFTLPKYADLVVDKTPANVPREDVDKYMAILQNQHATFSPISEERAVQEGDSVRIDLECVVDDRIVEDESNQDADVELGKGTLAAGIESELIGMCAGDSKEIAIDFEADYSSKSLAGEHAIFRLILHAITEKQVPSLDDEFSKDLGYESYEKLFGVIWNNIVEEEKALSYRRQREEVLHQLIEKTEIEVPESLVDEYVRKTIESIQKRLSRDNQTPEQAGIDMEKLPSELREDAIKQTKQSWMFDEIAENEGIRITDDELDLEIRRAAEQQDRDLQKYTNALKESNHLEEFRQQLRFEKIYRFLVDKSSAKESLIIT